MGFSIGGIRELRNGSRRRGRVGTAVAEYTGRCGWDVVPGARAARGGADRPRGACSCGTLDCPSPGVRPVSTHGRVPAGSSPGDALAAWSATPDAEVLLPVGRWFDVLEVGEPAGRHALARLERMGLPLGPVSLTPHRPHGRAQFFVAPGAADQLPRLLYRMGWDDADLDLRCLGPGDYVLAPPTQVSGLGPVRWLRAPTPEASRCPPHARLLLGTLAYVCHRSAA